ncbi:tandem-95 repeat protein [Pseudocolwellia sp. HL-MZ7]|uniref:tandem-95 repeat protein n=1 Tax=Pseudocolwellia sp. HL-MZ7 TaxID=3400627 RepID=UPI003CF88653
MLTHFFRHLFIATSALTLSFQAFGATPTVTNELPASAFAGEEQCFDVGFSNTGTTGYGPYIRLITDAKITLNSASMFGNALSVESLGDFSSSGTITDSLSNSEVTGTQGDALHIIKLSVGSVVANGPMLNTSVCITLGASADIGENLNVDAQPVYQYGDSATGDTAIIGTKLSANIQATVTSYEYRNDAIESEIVPGPNFLLTYRHIIDVANSKQIFNTLLQDTLDNNLQFTAPVSITGGTNCTVDDEPESANQGGMISVSCDNIQGSNSLNDSEIRISGYVPESVLNGASCSAVTIQNNATFDSEYPAGTTLTQLASTGTTITAKHLAVQQSFSETALSPGQVITITDNIQLSEYDEANGLVLVDTLPDGLIFTAHTSMTVSGVTTSITPTTGTSGDDTTVTYDIHSVTGDLAASTTITIQYTATVQQAYKSTDSVFASDALGSASLATYSLTAGAVNCMDNSSAGGVIIPITTSKVIVNSAAEYVPGQAVTFRLSMNIPSGDTQNIVFDDFFPLPVFDVTSISTSFGTDIVLSVDDTAGLTPSNIEHVSSTNSLNITWPDLNTTEAKVISVDITATISTDPFSDELSLTNLFQGSTENTAGEAALEINSVPLMVRAPSLSITLIDNASATVDAGDVITYTLTIENTGGADAHDITANAPAITGLDGAVLTSVTVDDTATTAYSGTLADGDLTLNNAVPAGSIVVITYTRDVSDDVTPRQTINSTAEAAWASANGAPAFPAESSEKTLTVASASISTSINSVSPNGSGSSSNFVVGDTVTYLVEVTLPEGETSGLSITTELPGGVEFDASSPAVSISGFAGTVDTDPTVTPTGSFTSGQDVVFNFDSPSTTTVTGDNDTSNNTFSFTFDAIVRDVAANAALNAPQTKTLDTDLTYNSFSGTTVNTSVSGSFVEHELEVTTSLSPSSSLQAGDTVTTTITVKNVGTATAYDIDINSALNANLFDLTTGATADTTAPGYTYTYNGTSVDYITTGSLAVNETVTFTYTAVVKDDVQSGASYSTVTSGTADSQSGDVALERDNSTNVTETASTTNPTADSLTLISSSESWTSESGTPVFAIGEVAKYSLQVTIPEGTTAATAANALIDVTLPAGVGYVDGTATVRGVFDTGLSSAVESNLSTTDQSITATVDANNVLKFDLGDITNIDNDGNAEYIIVTFDAVYLNTEDNNRTDNKTLNGQIHYNNQSNVAQADSASTSGVIGTPHLSLTNIATPDSVDGGDTLNYTLTATNDNQTDVVRGWEWLIEETLPTRLNSPSITSATITRANSSTVDVSSCASFSGNDLTVDSSCLTDEEQRYLDAGESLEVKYSANVDVSIGFEEQVSTIADFSITTLPGAKGTNDAAPGAADSDTGERTGSQENNTSSQAVNDLIVMTTEVITANAPTVSLITSAENANIKDTVTLTATFGIPTGTTDDFVYTLDLPAGLTFDNTPIAINLPASDFSATLNPSTTPGSGTDPIILDFGTIENSSTNAQSVSIEIEVSVDNILTNQQGVELDSTATLNYAGVTTPPSSDVTIAVTEPNLAISHTIISGATGSDAGDTISYQTVLTNTSTDSTAFRADLLNIIPASLLGAPDGTGSGSEAFSNITLTNTNNDVVLTGTSTVASVSDVSQQTTNLTGDTLQLATVDLPPLSTLTLTYDVVVANSASAGDSVSDQITASYFSTLTGDARDGSTENSDDDSDTLLNNYNESGSSTVTIHNSIAVQSELNELHANNNHITIGETVSIDLRVDVIEGDISDVLVINTLPDNLEFKSSTLSAGSNIHVTGDATIGSVDGNNVTIDLGDVSNVSDGDTTNDFFMLTIVATVLDEADNSQGTTLTNSAIASGGGATATASTLDIVIIEPNLVAEITSNKSTVSLGDSVVYTVEITPDTNGSDAFDTSLELKIPSGLTYVNSSFDGNGTLDDTDSALLKVDLGSITVVNGKKTFSFEMTVDNNADIDHALLVELQNGKYSSLVGEDTNEREYSFSDSLAVTSNSASFINAGQTFIISNDLNGDGYADPGDTLTIEATLYNDGSDTTGVVFTGNIPNNTTYVANSVTTTGTITETATQITADIGSLNSGTSAIITYEVVVNENVADGTTITAQGSVDSDLTVSELTDADNDDSNGDQANSLVVGAPTEATNNLYVEQSIQLSDDTDNNTAVSVGDTLTVTYNLSNLGTEELTGITLADIIPAGLSYLDGTFTISDGTGSVTTDNLSAVINTLAAGSSVSVTFDVSVETEGSYDLQGNVGSDQTPTENTDSNSSEVDGYQASSINAIAQNANATEGAPDVVVNEYWTLTNDVDGDGNVDPGDTVRYDFSLLNQGSVTATDVDLQQPIPTNTTLVSGSGIVSQGSIVTTEPYDANVGSVLPGSSVTGSFSVVVDAGVADDTVISSQLTASGTNFTDTMSDDNANSADNNNPTLFTVTSADELSISVVAELTETSDTDTVDANFVQGEELSLALTVSIPAGSLNDANLVFTLPPLLTYVENSATLTSIFETGLHTANNPNDINDAATDVPVNLDVTQSGQLITLPLGGIVNSDNDTNLEQYVLFLKVNTDNLVPEQATTELAVLGELNYVDGLNQRQQVEATNLALTLVNQTPVANNDSQNVDEDSNATFIDVLTNDTESDTGQTLTVLSVDSISSGGSAIISTGPSGISYQPAADFYGTETITYSISDGAGGSASATLTVEVSATPDAPQANGDTASLNEDGMVTIIALSNDVDVDDEDITILSVSVPANEGTVIINSDGNIVFTPLADFNGIATITYTITDGNTDAGSSSATNQVAVTVVSVNDAPVVVSETRSVDEDNSLTIDVLNNDSDVDGDTLTVTAYSTEEGTVELSENGEIIYTPSEHFHGTNIINYTVSDGTIGVDGTVTVTVNSINDLPILEIDAATIDEDTSVEIDVLANDSDADGDTLSVTGLSVDNGTVSITEEGAILFVPDADFNGTSTISYTVFDGQEGVETTTIVTVDSVNDAPIANSDIATTDEDTTVIIDVLNNDTDVDDDALTIIDVSTDSGEATITEEGKVEFVPTANFNGEATLSYTISDGNDAEVVGTVAITVNSVNDVPVIGINEESVNEDTSITITGLANVTDVDGDTLTVSGQSVDTGSVSLSESGSIVYVPDADFNGTATITYTIKDGNGAEIEVTAEVTVVSVNDAPVVVSETRSVDEDNSLTIDVLNNDSDVDGDTLTVTAYSTEEGIVELSENGEIIYTPSEHFHGTNIINYTVSDGTIDVDGTVTVTVNSINDLPIPEIDAATIDEDTSVEIDVLANDSDADGDTLSVTELSVDNGTVSITEKGAILFVPDADFNGTSTISYTVFDGQEGVETTTIVTVDSVNDAPIANSDIATLNEDTNITFDVLINDTDVEGDTLTITEISVDTGIVNISATGEVTYTPLPEFNGTAIISYTISDGQDAEASTTATITVISINDSPVINDITANTLLSQGVIIDVLSATNDVDMDALSISSAISENGTVIINSDGTITFTPTDEFVGVAIVNVCVSDINGGVTCTDVSVTVVDPNVAPTVNDVALKAIEDTSLTFTLVGSDLENDDLTFILIDQPNGEVSGSLPLVTYTPPANFNGETTLTYQANDGKLDSNIATITITVESENDLPVAIDDNVTIFSFDPTEIDVLANDTDVDEDDVLSVIGATASIGEVSWTTTGLSYTPDASFVGSTFVEYTIEDSSGATDTAIVFIDINTEGDELLPVISVPEDIFIDANALFTKVDLGEASAVDRFGQPLPVSLVDGLIFYEPGVNTAFWSAMDEEGRVSIASQLVKVRPLVSIDKDQEVLEGHTISVGVHLNGHSPEYPLSIPYTVTGSADGSDHTLVDGVLIFESGSNELIKFEVLADDVMDPLETITITLSDTINRGNKFEHNITIREDNVDPDVTLVATQSNEQRVVITQGGENVTISSNIIHPNANNEYLYTWDNIEGVLIDEDSEIDTFSFNPNNVPLGLYQVTLDIVDLDDTEFDDKATIFIEVVSTLATLTSADSDGDGIPDDQEGFSDSDGDGIPDYLDAISECNVLPEQGSFTKGYLVEGDPGVCLHIGTYAFTSNTGGAQVSDETDSDNTDENTEVLEDDLEATNVGGIFNFIAYGLPDEGQSYKIVMPQRRPVPENAVYRKYFEDTGWFNFVETGNNFVRSTAGEPGYCPPPGGNVWEAGLIEGYWCVEIEIVDGGPNDADGLVNGTIIDPGGVGVLGTGGNTLPEAEDDEVELVFNTSIEIDILGNDVDADGDLLEITSATAFFGEVEIINNALFYTPPENFIGQEQITYGISDGNGGTDIGTVRINIISNNPPIAVDDVATVDVENSIIIDVLSNDTDPNNDIITLVDVTSTSGTVFIMSDGTISFTPAAGESGIVFLDYIIADERGAEATAQVTITVNKVTVRIDNSSGGAINFGTLFMLISFTLFVILRRNNNRKSAHYAH